MTTPQEQEELLEKNMQKIRNLVKQNQQYFGMRVLSTVSDVFDLMADIKDDTEIQVLMEHMDKILCRMLLVKGIRQS